MFKALVMVISFIIITSSPGLSTPKQNNYFFKKHLNVSSEISLEYLEWIKKQKYNVPNIYGYLPYDDLDLLETNNLQNNAYRTANYSSLLQRYKEEVRKRNKGEFQNYQEDHSNRKNRQLDLISSQSSDVLYPLNKESGLSSKKGRVYGPAVSSLIGIMTAIMSCITIGGNILVITAFYLERSLRMPTNYFIASLAVTDVLIGVFSMNLYSLYLIIGYWPLGRLLCDLWLGLDYTACLTSQYTVFFITLDRFFSVKIPAKYRNWRTDKKILIMVAITWIIPSSIFFTTLLGWPYFSTNNYLREKDQCYAEFSSDPLFNTILTIAYFWITLLVMISLYIGIYRVALNLQKRSEMKRAKVNNLVEKTVFPLNTNANCVVSKHGSINDIKDGENQISVAPDSFEFASDVIDEPESLTEKNTTDAKKKKTENKIKSKSIFQNNYDSKAISMTRKNKISRKNFSYLLFSMGKCCHNKKKSLQSSSFHIERGRTENRARKALKTISFILGAFVICWIPYHVLILIKGLCDNPKESYTCVNEHLYSISYWFCYLNSPINPFCYALANAQFKKTFLRILRFNCKRR